MNQLSITAGARVHLRTVLENLTLERSLALYIDQDRQAGPKFKEVLRSVWPTIKEVLGSHLYKDKWSAAMVSVDIRAVIRDEIEFRFNDLELVSNLLTRGTTFSHLLVERISSTITNIESSITA